MAKTVWQDAFIIRVYNLAKSGMRESQMAKVLGISLPTFIIWKKKRKQFHLALQTGRKEHRGDNGHVISFKDYVYARLPADLRKVWSIINRLDEAKGGREKIEAILARRGKIVRQHLFIYAWTSTNFSISSALRKVNISRSTFKKWSNDDPDFAKLIDEINWHKKNFFEDHLCTLVAKGDGACTIFANRTFNRDRGYNEKVTVDMNLSGEIDQTVMSVDMMKLPLETRKEILKSLRKQKQNHKQG